MQSNNKRILKNTIYLYIRQLVIMGLSFFTTRIVLDKLGASDYGLNNLIAGFVSSFTMLDSILNGSTSRFIALALGKKDISIQRRTFSTAFVIHLICAMFIVLILESLGVWIINSGLNIENERLWVANWVFQFSVLGIFLKVTQTPFTASVTAHEKFDMYAYMSIYDVLAKLLVLFLLVYLPWDKLLVYSALLLLVNATSIAIYRIYCLRKFEECTNSFIVDKPLCKEMLKFSGYDAFGHVIMAVNGQGTSILLNVFFNTIMNAARGLSTTVLTTITTFISGFQLATLPQLIKYYGCGNKTKFESLIFNASQYSLFIVSIFIMPVVLEIDYVLDLWLSGNVPQYTSDFIRVTMLCTLIYNSSFMIDKGLHAAGWVKQMNMYSMPIYLFTLPLQYVVLKMGMSPVLMYWVANIPPLLTLFLNTYFLSKYEGFHGKKYLKSVCLKTSLLIALSSIIPIILHFLLPYGFFRFLVVCTTSVLLTSAVMYRFALNNELKQTINAKLKRLVLSHILPNKDVV